MDITGSIQIRAEAAEVTARLYQSQVLAGLLPGTSRVIPRKEPGVYDISIVKRIAIFDLSQRGVLTLVDQGQGRHLMTVTAQNLIAGSVDLTANLQVVAVKPKRTEVTYTANLKTTGLAARMLAEHQDRVQPYLTRVFQKLRQKIEAGAGETPATPEA